MSNLFAESIACHERVREWKELEKGFNENCIFAAQHAKSVSMSFVFRWLLEFLVSPSNVEQTYAFALM